MSDLEKYLDDRTREILRYGKGLSAEEYRSRYALVHGVLSNYQRNKTTEDIVERFHKEFPHLSGMAEPNKPTPEAERWLKRFEKGCSK